MNIKNCVFCRIITGELPSSVVAQSADVLVINDISPKAPIHYLVMPKEHVKDFCSLASRDDSILMARINAMICQLAAGLPGSQSFQLITNTGSEAGQSVFHFHFHFLSGINALLL
jgi:histidine triad (HIT) family protein